MGISTAGKDIDVDAFAAQIDEISLHTGDPGDTGALFEVTGITRLAPTYLSAIDAVADLTDPLDFTIPVGVFLVTYWSGWSSGTYAGSKTTTPGSYTGGGVYTLEHAPIEHP